MRRVTTVGPVQRPCGVVDFEVDRLGQVLEHDLDVTAVHRGFRCGNVDPSPQDPTKAGEAEFKAAAASTIPTVWPLFWSFRIMVALGFLMLFTFAAGFWLNATKRLEQNRWFLRLAVAILPAPWLACEFGWFVAEFGRQPWAIGEVLPTFLATSSLTVGDLIFSLAGFLTFYTLLLVIEVWLMVKFARLGPSSLGTGRYHFERGVLAAPAE